MADITDPVFKPPKPLTLNEPSTTTEPLPDLPPPLTDKNPPEGVYFLEIMNNGSIISRFDISKNRISFGRSRDADVPLDHPSISRYHAVILWKDSEQSDRGYFYLMDLNSTHGSILNKNRVNPGSAVKIPIGNNVIKFGGSTRSIMLNSIITETQEAVQMEESKEIGCSWGMGEDASAENDEQEDEEAFMDKFTTLLNTPQNEPSPNENAFYDNPQKTLQIWFDQEGYDFDYQVIPEGSNFKATIQLPIEGRDVPIEGPSQSKKKDAIVQLCLKVCKLLDRAERLFPWQHQNSRKRNRNKVEEEDEEDLYDETEQSKAKKAKKLIEEKLREKQAGAETYESLKIKYEEWSKELSEVEEQMKILSQPVSKSQLENEQTDDVLDPLDQFMEKELVDDSKRMNFKIEKSKLKLKIKDLQKKLSNCEKLMSIARPTHIPSFHVKTSKADTSQVRTTDKSTSKVGKTETVVLEEGCNEIIEEKPKQEKFQMKLIPKILSKPKAFSDPDPITVKDETKKVAPPLNTGLSVGSSLKKMKEQELVASENHEDFINWVPPKNQDGSGKTSLNDKFGY